MPVIDVQVHPFDRNHPGRPWASPSHGLDAATGEEMVAAMASVGVDGAIMVSSFSAYEYDPSYALEALRIAAIAVAVVALAFRRRIIAALARRTSAR